MAGLLTVLPIWVAVVRNGLHHWIPVGDAATTALRANDVFSAHPPLVGMYSAASTWAGHDINFPAAWQLYFMSIPQKLFGNSWGVLIGVAIMNTVWLLLAGWLIRRRVGYLGGTIGFAFLASFAWALGSEVLVDITPMQMVTVPCLLLLVAAWSVADGDLLALPVLALVTNYLFLDHLTLSATVPIMTVTALVLLVLDLRRRRRSDAAGWPELRKRLKRSALVAGGITLVAWTPPLIQEFFANTPPNLTNLFKASQATPPRHTTLWSALSAVGSTVAAPPWWARPTFHIPSYHLDGSGRPLLLVAGFSAFLLAAYALGMRTARRRGDHTVWSGLVCGLVAGAAAVVTTLKSTNPFGLQTGYLHSLWPTAVFVWLLLLLAGLRLIRRGSPTGLRRWAVAAPTATAAVFSILCLPTADLGSGTWPQVVDPARKLDEQVVPAVKGRSPVLLVAPANLELGAIHASMALALQEAGVDFLVTVGERHQFGYTRAAYPGISRPRSVVVISTSRTPPKGYVRIGAVLGEPGIESAEFKALDDAVHQWATDSEVRINPDLVARDPNTAGLIEKGLDELYTASRKTGTEVVNLPAFTVLAAGSTDGTPWLDTRGTDPAQLKRWADTRNNARARNVYAYLGPGWDTNHDSGKAQAGS